MTKIFLSFIVIPQESLVFILWRDKAGEVLKALYMCDECYSIQHICKDLHLNYTSIVGCLCHILFKSEYINNYGVIDKMFTTTVLFIDQYHAYKCIILHTEYTVLLPAYKPMPKWDFY